jgi:hypothetical protein
MDKQLLQSFNNLSVALEALANSLEKNAKREADGESSIADALKKLDVSDHLKLLSEGIEQIHKDNEKMAKSQKDILQNLAKLTQKQKEDGKKIESTQQAIKGKKDQGAPDYVPDKKEKKTITDGVKIILLIAAGILAIGIAFKLIGNVNIKTVFAIGLVLPLIAIAYKKIAEIKVDLKDLKDTAKGLIIFSAAIAAASWVLSLTKVISLPQAMTMVLIAATFALVAPRIAGMVASMKDISVKGLLMMPLVLVVTAMAIAASSYLLALVMPISIPQAITTLMIAATFAVLAMSIGKLAKSVSGVSVKGVIMLPLVLVVTSLAIMASSYFLNKIQPVGMPQLFTAIGIAAVFAVVAFGMEKVARAASRVSPIGAIMMPIILVATSYAIYKSSEFLSRTMPITMQQFITAIGISVVFVVLSFALPMLAKAVEKINIGKAALMPVVFVTLSIALMASSYILAETKMISLSKLFNIALQAVTVTVIAVVMGLAVFALDKMGLASSTGLKKTGMAAASILVIAGTVALASGLLAMGDYSKAPGWQWSLEAALSILAFGLLAFGISKIGLGPGMAIKGGVVILAVAAVIVATDFILSAGDYTKYPSWEWTLQSGASILAYGLLAVAASFGILLIPIGAAAILIIAGTILLTDMILSEGKYAVSPPLEWTKSTLLSIGGFGLAMAGFALLSPLLILGAVSIGIIALAVLGVDKLFAEGDFTKGPTFDYAKSVVLLLTTYGALMAATGLLLPLLMLGKKSMMVISEAIVESAAILAGGNFTGGPDVRWAMGVSLALGAFAPVFRAISSQGIIGAIFGGGASAAQMSDAIIVISKAIVDAALFFEGAKVAFKGGPSKEWSEGVGGAIGAFAPVLGVIQDKGYIGKIFGGGSTPEKMSQAITSIAGAIVVAAGLFYGSSALYEGGPKKEWSEGVGAAITAFAPVLQDLQGSGFLSSMVGTSAEDMSKAIVTVAGGLIEAGRVFMNPDVTYDMYPKKEWSEGVGLAITAFGPAMKWASENSGWFGSSAETLKGIIIGIADSIVEVSTRVANGNYTTVLDPKYFEAVRLSYGEMYKIYEQAKMYEVEDDQILKPATIGLGMAQMSQMLAMGNYTPIPREYMGDVYENVVKYMKIVDLLAYRQVSSGIMSLFSSTAVDIVRIASDYDRLTESITRLSTAISAIDVDKMSALRSLTGTVVLMSLMDTNQFNSMMDAFEERAGVLVDTINSMESDVQGAQQGGAQGGAGAGVRTPAKAAPAESPGTAKIVEALGRIEQQLAMISSSTTTISTYVSQLRANNNTTSLKSRK